MDIKLSLITTTFKVITATLTAYAIRVRREERVQAGTALQKMSWSHLEHQLEAQQCY